MKSSQLGRIFAAFLLLTLTIFFINFFIAAINDSLIKAQNYVIPSKLYDLVDNFSLGHDEMKKRFLTASVTP